MDLHRQKRLFFAFLLFFTTGMQATVNLNNGLVGHWKFDELSGTTASDSSGNSYDAVLFNAGDGSNNWNNGKVNGSIYLDGTNDYLAIQDLHYNQAGQIPAVSISAWIKTSKANQGMIISYDRSEHLRFSVGGDNDNGKLFLATTDLRGSETGTVDTYSNNTVHNNQWRHVLVTYDSSSSLKKFYIDGSLDRSVSAHGNRNLGSGTQRYGIIGTNCEDINFNQMQEGDRTSYNFQGYLDDLRLYDRVLNISEIAHLYNNAITDTDSDGLFDAEEESLGTNANSTDTDGDGLTDYEEVVGVHTYEKIGPTERTWHEAKTNAESLGGYLATITSSSEQSTVQALLSSGNLSWLGASDHENEGTWKWVTGELVPTSANGLSGYKNWNTGEPNNNDGIQDYMHIYSDSRFGKWDDAGLSTDTMAYYILEKVLITDPNDSDTDDDGFSDSLENDVGSNPNDAASTPMQVGLQAYYPFEGNASDTSGNNYNGELAGTANDPTAGNDRFNQPTKSYYFDGGDRLKLDHRGLHGFSEFSISIWTKVNSFSSWPLLLSAANGSTHNELMFIPGDSKKFLFKDSSSTQSFVFTDWLNKWKNITVSKASSSAPIKVYVDGELENSYDFSSSGSLNVPSNGLWLGADQDSVGGGWQNGQALNGWLDDIRFYNRALSAEEVNATYQLTKFTNVAPSDLSISSGTVTENGSVGDTVGNFSATDANDPHNIIDYTYTLVSGSGSTDNALFTLESNGTLKAGAVFDYEEQTTRSIRVQVSDEYADNYEEVFVISIGDVDDTAPIITRTGDQNITHEAGTTFTDLGAIANDTIDGNLTANVVTTGTVDINTPDTYTLTYTVSDAAGNAAISVTRNVTVVDTIAPIITRTGDQNITHEAATTFTDPGVTANDTLDGNLTAHVVTIGTVDIITPGTYTLTYTLSDAAGNAASSVTRNVTVVDTTAPIITRTGDQNITHEAASSYTDLGATVNDTLEGNLTAHVVTIGTVDINTPGTYTLTYTVSDAAGNVAISVTRNITVVDTTAPIITRTGDQNITHEAATTFTDIGATASDNLDGNLTTNVVTIGIIDTGTPGTYTLTYTVSDTAGNAATTWQRKITVKDTTAPVITLEGNATVDLWVWETYTEEGATASDTLDGNLTNAITISGTVDTGTPGTYTLTYTVSDTAGNAATPLIRTVTVTNRAPIALSLSNQSVEEGWPAGTLVGSLATTDPDDATGSRAYTYQVVSGSGYTINGSQLVTASILDFETVPSTDVLIRTNDQFGGSHEQSFAIATIDAFVPGVTTLSASGVTASSALLSGKVEDDGHGGGVIKHGFVIGQQPDPEKAGGTNLTAAVNGTALSATVSGLIAGRVYFYKAYARNAEGINYGAQERFMTPEEIGSDLWASAQSVGANWLQSDWFGSFYLTDTPWLYHHGLGWMFTIGTTGSDLWIWNDDLGWVWTARGVFPHLYSHLENDWYHWNGSTDKLRLFYRYSDAQWVDFSNSSTGGKL